MAPEQAWGESLDGRTDLFSLGCVLYRLVAGHQPFQGKTPLAQFHALANYTPLPLRRVADVPESFSALVASLLARRPDDRPASAQAVVEALAAIEKECAAPRPKRGWRPGLLLAVIGPLVLALGALAVTVLRMETAEGEIVIRTSDPKVSVLFEQGKVQLHDRARGRKYTLVVGRQKKPEGARAGGDRRGDGAELQHAAVHPEARRAGAGGGELQAEASRCNGRREDAPAGAGGRLAAQGHSR
jgi:hypothetical protein